MNITEIIIPSLIVFIILIKIYSMFNTINKKGIKAFLQGFFKQKLIVFSIIAVIVGTFVLFNPNHKIENPKDLVFNYVSEFLKN